MPLIHTYGAEGDDGESGGGQEDGRLTEVREGGSVPCFLVVIGFGVGAWEGPWHCLPRREDNSGSGAGLHLLVGEGIFFGVEREELQVGMWSVLWSISLSADSSVGYFTFPSTSSIDEQSVTEKRRNESSLNQALPSSRSGNEGQPKHAQAAILRTGFGVADHIGAEQQFAKSSINKNSSMAHSDQR